MYTRLAQYYDQIFKDNPAEHQFVQQYILKSDQKALDLGCGTGKTAIHLAKNHLSTLGIDMNATMIEYAKKSYSDSLLSFKVWDITNLERLQEVSNIDIVTCFGNTLVHLKKQDAKKLLDTLYTRMNPGARLLIQIINYDRIFHHKIKELPIVEDEDLRFTRQYDYHEKEEHLLFRTQVLIKKEQRTLSDETVLYPMRKEDLIVYGMKAGFLFRTSYGNFKRDKFNFQESYHLIVVFEKPL